MLTPWSGIGGIGLGLRAGMLLAVCSAAGGAEYCLSPQGDDQAPGSLTAPWRSLDKANTTAVAGDTITLLAGEYEGQIAPRNRGTPEHPIVFRAAAPLTAVLRGLRRAPAIVLRDRTDIVLDGLAVRPTDGYWATLEKSERIIVRGCRFEESRGSYTAFRVANCRGVRILDNVFTRQLLLHRNLVLHGDMLTLDHCDRCVVQGNDFSKAGHGPATWLLTTNDVIRRNVFHAEWGRLFSLFNCTPCLFEENILTENCHGSGSADAGSKILLTDGIVRRNLAVRNRDYVIHSYSYKYGDYPDWILKDTRVYHNTFAGNGGHAWGLSAPTNRPDCIAGTVWQNNIFFAQSLAGGSAAFRIDTDIAPTNRWVRNLLCGQAPGAEVVIQWDPTQRRLLPLTVAAAETHYPARFRDNLDALPGFAAPETDDYSLAAGSPCLDRGAPLAVLTEDSNDDVLHLDDARWFYDGFGIEGEMGDLIMIGTPPQLARVLQTDRTANTLKLDRRLTCLAGAPVSLPYAGTAPDLGALEADAAGADWFRPLTIPPGVRRPAVGAKEPLVVADFEDASLETWATLWYWGRFDIPGSNLSAERIAADSPYGQQCVRLFAEADNVALEATLCPWPWDVDTHPLLRFAYRIPAGIPVTACVSALPGPGQTGERSVVLAATAAVPPPPNPAFPPAALLDDGQWHEITLDARQLRTPFPDAKALYSFRFRSPTKFQRGQEFWFTHFAILPGADPAK
jgi:hypothetical protein